MKQIKTKTNFLILTKLDGFQDLSQPCIYLEEWCIPDNEKQSFDHNKEIVFDHPALRRIDSRHSFNFTAKIYERLLPKLSQWLNTTHHVNYSLQYWRIVIGPFLLHYIQTLYQRVVILKKAHALHHNLDTIGITPESFITLNSTADFLYCAGYSDAWNHQLLTQIWNILFKPMTRYKNNHWDLESDKLPSNSNRDHCYSLKAKLLINLTTFFVKLFRKKIVGLCGTDIIFCGKKNLLKLILLSKLRIIPIFIHQDKKTPNQNKKSGNNDIRRQLVTLENESRFSRLILETLIVNLPLDFLENYNDVVKRSAASFPYQPSVIFAIGWLDNALMQCWAAQCAEAGSKLVSLQHGGTYGHFEYHTHEQLERNNTDIFISCGWIDKNVIAAPVILTSELIKEAVNNNTKRDKILWTITPCGSTYPFFLPFFSAQKSTGYIAWQKRFLQATDCNILHNITIRPKPGHKIPPHFQSDWKTIKIDSGNNKETFFERLQDTKILIVDNLNTTFLYGLALNIPTILFWDKKFWPIRNNAKPHFKLLHEAKIYHATPESAAEFLNEMADNPTAWWNSKPVQEARTIFCDTYMHTSEHYLKDWKKILLNIQTNTFS
ncbi:MAG: hypothetical protein A3E82_00635 [Gammaproteobacteria bacterium RIFCSPHIGHO2_12_FULL_38_11]|nr:MAG: hypothetical protein A3E82_00635 [Gammaproteobacteria bacterium RIFCSPHIGHO2_12_FULL_38_11]